MANGPSGPSTSWVSACPPSRSSASYSVTRTSLPEPCAARRDVRRRQPGHAGPDDGEPPRRTARPSGRLEVEQRDDLRRLLGTALRLDADAGADRVVGVTRQQRGGLHRPASGRPRPSRRSATAATAGRPCRPVAAGMSSVTSTARCSLAERTIGGRGAVGRASWRTVARPGRPAPVGRGQRGGRVVPPRLPDDPSDAHEGEDDRRHQGGKPLPAGDRTAVRPAVATSRHERWQRADPRDVLEHGGAQLGRWREGRRRRRARQPSRAGWRPPRGRWRIRSGVVRS